MAGGGDPAASTSTPVAVRADLTGGTRSNVVQDQPASRDKLGDKGGEQCLDLLALPPEVLVHFLGCLDMKMLWSMRSVCTRLRHTMLAGVGMRAVSRRLRLAIDVLCVSGFGRHADDKANGRNAIRATLTDLRAFGDCKLALTFDDLWEFGADFVLPWLSAMRVTELKVDYEPMPTTPSREYNNYQATHHTMLNQRSLDLCRHVAQTIDVCAHSLADVQLLRIEWPWCEKRRWECVQKAMARCDSVRTLRYQCDDVLPPCYTTMFGPGRLANMETLSVSARVRDYDSVHPPGTLQNEMADGMLMLPKEGTLRTLQLHTNAFDMAIRRMSSKLSDCAPDDNPMRNVCELWLYSDHALPDRRSFYTALERVFPRLTRLVIRVEDCYQHQSLVEAVKCLNGTTVPGAFKHMQELVVLNTCSSADDVSQLDARDTGKHLEDHLRCAAGPELIKCIDECATAGEGADNVGDFVPHEYFDAAIGRRGPSYPKDRITCRYLVQAAVSAATTHRRLAVSVYLCSFAEGDAGEGVTIANDGDEAAAGGDNNNVPSMESDESGSASGDDDGDMAVDEDDDTDENDNME